MYKSLEVEMKEAYEALASSIEKVQELEKFNAAIIAKHDGLKHYTSPFMRKLNRVGEEVAAINGVLSHNASYGGAKS